MTKLALFVELKAKPRKDAELRAFLIDAQALAVAEPATVTWFALQLDPHTFAIFDAFNEDGGREAHLNGQIAAALMARADELLASPPQIRKAEVLSDKLPG